MIFYIELQVKTIFGKYPCDRFSFIMLNHCKLKEKLNTKFSSRITEGKRNETKNKIKNLHRKNTKFRHNPTIVYLLKKKKVNEKKRKVRD